MMSRLSQSCEAHVLSKLFPVETDVAIHNVDCFLTALAQPSWPSET